MTRVLRQRSLGIVLLILFLASWAGQAWTGWQEFQAEQAEHGQGSAVWGDSGYIWPFLQATMENWQSEFLQLITFVVLTSFLIWRGSPESRDGQDEMMASIRRIEAHLGIPSAEQPVASNVTSIEEAMNGPKTVH